MSQPTFKRYIFSTVRIVICAGALWLVLRGVTLQDSVLLEGGEEVFGRIESRGDEGLVLASGDGSQSIAAEEIARQDDGSFVVSYGLLSAWSETIGWLLVAAVLLHLPVALFQAVRLCWLLSAQHISLGFWESLKLTFAGNFLNFATPLGSNAGDVFKAYFVALHTEHKTEAVTTVILDRVVGLCSLLFVVALITFVSSSGRLAELRPYILGVVGLVLLGVLLYISPLFRMLLNMSWLRRLPFFGHVERIDATARKLLGRPDLLCGGVLITIVLQVTAMSAYIVVAKAVGLEVIMQRLAEMYAYFFVGCLVQALPGPPQGLGTVELTYRYFFSPFGTVSQILCMAFLIRLMVLICALPGVLVTLTGSYRPSAARTLHGDLPEPTELAGSIEPAVR